MSTEDTRESGREGAPASSEQRTEPQARDPNIITDADRAANPLGAARREREMHRDQGGRFAPKQTDGKEQDGRQAKPEDHDDGDKPSDQGQQDRQQPGQVPHQALAAERGKRQAAVDENAALRREIAELRGMVQGRQQQPAPAQQPTPPPEFWQDPNAAMEYRLRQAMSPVEQQLQQHRLGTSQMLALQQHGREAVSSAVQALGELRQTNPAEFQRLEAMAERSFDPVGDVVRWHKQTTAMREIGDDPQAYRERLRAELLAEMQQGGGDPQQHAPPANQRQPVQAGPLPTSFAAARSGGPRGGPAYGGPRSLDQIMGR